MSLVFFLRGGVMIFYLDSINEEKYHRHIYIYIYIHIYIYIYIWDENKIVL